MNLSICFAGNPSSGKSTCANYLKEYLGNKASFVEERARKYIEQWGGINDSRDQYNVGLLQLDDELTARQQDKKYLITECPAWISLAYMKMYFSKESEYERRSVFLEQKVNSLHYDILFYCTPTGNYVEDGIRYQKPEELETLEKHIKETIDTYHTGKIIVLPVNKVEREKVMKKVIGELNGN